MRLAPIVLAMAHDPGQAIRLAGDMSRTTHGAATCVDACRYFAGLLVGALDGVPKEVLLSPRWSPVPGLWDEQPLDAEVDAVAGGSFQRRQPPQIRGKGFVVASLEAALWALSGASTYREASLRAVNLGDDADTTGAIVGQLAGALWGVGGEAGVPADWVEKLSLRPEIERLARQLGELSTRTRGVVLDVTPLGRRAYWVAPGKLMAGPYPGNVDPAQAQRNVEALHVAGIRHIVNLMEEDETNWQGLPFTPYAPMLPALGMSTKRFAVRDLTAPSVDLMETILDDIDAAIAEGRPVYVHCWGGRGRTGTAVGCWLVRPRFGSTGCCPGPHCCPPTRLPGWRRIVIANRRSAKSGRRLDGANESTSANA